MMSPFDDTAGMASEQSSREVLNCPLVAALTPKMSDAAIRASLQNLLPLSALVAILSVHAMGDAWIEGEASSH